MREARYILLGNPTPLARARYGRGKIWDAQKQLKLVTGIELERQHGNDPLFAGPLHLDLTFFMPIPKTSVKRTRLICGTPHIYRPDVDNLEKFILDIASGIVYKDDCCVSSLVAKKLYDTNPRTEIVVTEIEYVR